MNDLTVIGTLTLDRLHLHGQTRELLGGAPWFASELSKSKRIKIGVVTNVGYDFPINKFPRRILKSSKIIKVRGKTTTIDIFPNKKGVPAIIKIFTGPILKVGQLKGKVAIISPLLQEIPVAFIKKLRSKFDLIIVDVQGFTRPEFKPNIHLSDKIKKEPKDLKQLCKIVDIIKFSENEFKVVLPGLPIDKKLKMLHSWGLDKVIVTMAEKGCLISYSNKEQKLLPVKFKMNVNIVGAGDKLLILIGTFLAKNNSFEKSVIMAQTKLSKLMEEQL